MINTLTNELLNFENISQLTQQPLLKPQAEISIEFAEAISKKILLEKSSRYYPELIVIAHWLRKSHIIELKNTYEQMKQSRIWLARGTALHFAPANVDTIFMYSWMLSLLMGNNNIVRLSSRSSPQVDVLLKIIRKLFEEEKFKTLKQKNTVLRYKHNNIITEKLSSYCDLRIIWGGDQSVKTIRQISLPVHAKEIVFVDKFSIASFCADAVLNASKEQINHLTHQFYNDSFWFNQLACSSPRLIIWVGDNNNIKKAKELFWQSLEQYCKTHLQKIDPGMQMVRLAQCFEFAAKNQLKKQQSLPIESKYFSRIVINEFSKSMREQHRGGQLFLEWHLKSLFDVIPYLTEKDQTLSVYGFSKHELLKLIEALPHRAIDRIVPIGNALNFQTTWDGYALFQELTREVTLNIN